MFAEGRYFETKEEVGRLAQTLPVSVIQKRFHVPRGFVRYHKMKVADRDYKSGKLGGDRLSDPQRQRDIEEQLWILVQADPQMTTREYALGLEAAGLSVSRRSVSAVFARWRWSKKKAYSKTLNKYNAENMAYYAIFLYNIQLLDWTTLKFIDESHYQSRGMDDASPATHARLNRAHPKSRVGSPGRAQSCRDRRAGS